MLQWIEKLQNRLQCVHAKDVGLNGGQIIMAPVGEGNMNYPAIWDLLEKLGKTEYVLVEQDECYMNNPFACLESSYKYLNSLKNK